MTYDEMLKSLERNEVWQNQRTGSLVWVFELAEGSYVRFESKPDYLPQWDYQQFIKHHKRVGDL